MHLCIRQRASLCLLRLLQSAASGSAPHSASQQQHCPGVLCRCYRPLQKLCQLDTVLSYLEDGTWIVYDSTCTIALATLVATLVATRQPAVSPWIASLRTICSPPPPPASHACDSHPPPLCRYWLLDGTYLGNAATSNANPYAHFASAFQDLLSTAEGTKNCTLAHISYAYDLVS